MLLATAVYVVCIVGIIMMYIWYAPEPSCLLNIFFITWTLVLLQLMTSVSLHPKVSFSHRSLPWIIQSCLNLIWYIICKFSSLKQVNAGILTPGLMGLYVVFICWCAIRRHDFLSSNIYFFCFWCFSRCIDKQRTRTVSHRYLLAS